MQPPDADFRLSVLPHLHSPTSSCMFTLNMLRLVRWLRGECNQPVDPAEIHYSPTGLIFGTVWHPVCHLITQAQPLMGGWLWKGMARVREEGGRASFSSNNLSQICLSFKTAPLGLSYVLSELLFLRDWTQVKDEEEEVWIHTFYLVCSCFGWKMSQTINSSRDPPCVSATHHWRMWPMMGGGCGVCMENTVTGCIFLSI